MILKISRYYSYKRESYQTILTIDTEWSRDEMRKHIPRFEKISNIDLYRKKISIETIECVALTDGSCDMDVVVNDWEIEEVIKK